MVSYLLPSGVLLSAILTLWASVELRTPTLNLLSSCLSLSPPIFSLLPLDLRAVAFPLAASVLASISSAPALTK